MKVIIFARDMGNRLPLWLQPELDSAFASVLLLGSRTKCYAASDL